MDERGEQEGEEGGEEAGGWRHGGGAGAGKCRVEEEETKGAFSLYIVSRLPSRFTTITYVCLNESFEMETHVDP